MTANTLFLVSMAAIWMMLLYHVVLAIAGYRYQDRLTKTPPPITLPHPAPMVSILVPAHNEAKVIRDTVRALCSLDYPTDCYEVIVVNDRSTDDTGAILDQLCQRYPMLHPVHVQAPHGGRGKSAALNYGLTFARGSILAIYDADNTPERSALSRLVSTLIATPNLAAVVGKFRVNNAYRNILTRFINIETISFQWMVQGGRFQLFRLATIPGTNFVVNRDIIDQLGGWDESALAEDTEVSIRIYEQGQMIAFMPLAVTWEQEPETWTAWLKQRTRWVQGNTYVVRKYTRKLLSLHPSRISVDVLYFFMTYFGFLVGVLLSDVLFILSILHVIRLSMPGPFTAIWLLAYVLFAVEIVVTLEIEQSEFTWQNGLLVLLMYFTYSQAWLYLVLRGFVLQWRAERRKQPIVWQKTERF